MVRIEADEEAARGKAMERVRAKVKVLMERREASPRDPVVEKEKARTNLLNLLRVIPRSSSSADGTRNAINHKGMQKTPNQRINVRINILEQR